ncbi:MAG TPA: protein kinase [Terriglobales bacterium]|nr:protein kinase [Terriglobales bacterium]
MIGETVTHYKIEAALGAGGMGVVYRAEDTRLGRRVALKFLPPQMGRDPQALERFRREARALSALNHPGICTVYDIGEADDGRPFLVMELLEGETLQQRLQRGRLGVGEVLDYGLQIADALDAAHAKGVIHRDLKPANLFLTGRGLAKILDFGLAKMPAGGGSAADAGEQPTLADAGTVGALTSPGLAMGTIAYMSPEQALGKELDARSDIFSLGLVLYEMATGQAAFAGTTSAAVFDGILNRAPAPVAQRNPECPAGLQQAIETALEKDPQLRYQSAAELRGALRRLKRDTETGPVAAAGGSPAPARRRGRGRLLLAGVALALLAGGGAYAWRRSHAMPQMTAKDTVVLANFSNTTGDAMFDGTLRQALAVQLEQSPFLNIVSDQRMMQTEALMGLKAGTPVRGAAARQLCQRTGSAATLEGSIAQIGSQYNLILRAVNCESGDNLASVEQTADGKDRVLQALGELASAMRAKLGESLASMSQFNLPIEMVTTPSLAALKAYSQGRQQLSRGNYVAAGTRFRQALALDPNFAMAYASLGTADLDSNQTAQAEDNFKQAYARRDRVSPRERYYIAAHYDDTVTGDELQAERVYQLWEQTYPNDAVPYGNACGVERQLGQLAQALADCQAAVAHDPTNTLFASQLAAAEMENGQTAAAKALIAQGLQRAPDNMALHQAAYWYAVSLQEPAGLGAERAWLEAHGDADYLQEQDMVAAMRAGQRRKLQALLRSGVGAQNGDNLITLAVADALWGDAAAARRETAAALQRSRDENVLSGAGFALGLLGEAEGAARVDAQLQRRFSDFATQMVNLPTNRAFAALARQQPAEAVALLEPSQPYELGNIAAGEVNFARGYALLAEKQYAAAAAQFQTIMEHRFDVPYSSSALLELARAQALAGETAAARTSYQKLLGVWQHADADLPALGQARAELARLR